MKRLGRVQMDIKNRVPDKILNDLENLCKVATPGPWYNFVDGRVIKAESALSPKHDVKKDWNIAKYPMRHEDCPISHDEWKANAELIAKFREVLPLLIEEVKSHRKKI